MFFFPLFIFFYFSLSYFRSCSAFPPSFSLSPAFSFLSTYFSFMPFISPPFFILLQVLLFSISLLTSFPFFLLFPYPHCSLPAYYLVVILSSTAIPSLRPSFTTCSFPSSYQRTLVFFSFYSLSSTTPFSYISSSPLPLLFLLDKYSDQLKCGLTD
jgi:hypothetical protein